MLNKDRDAKKEKGRFLQRRYIPIRYITPGSGLVRIVHCRLYTIIK